MKTFLSTLSFLILFHSSSFAGVSVVGTLARSKSVKPGETFEGMILLKNSDDKPAQVRVKQTDYGFLADGSNSYGEPGTTPRSNANWISVTPTQAIIPANQTISIQYKGKVPADANLKGTYWSMIMVEPASPPAPVLPGQNKEIAVGLQTVLRFGVQIITELGDSGERKIKILDKQIVQVDGKRKLQLDIENTGERLMIPAIWVELYNDRGVSIGKFEAGRARIYPGCSVRSLMDVSDVPPGKYTAMVVVDNGDAHVMGAQYALEISR
jgi:hypothetical protein